MTSLYKRTSVAATLHCELVMHANILQFTVYDSNDLRVVVL